MSFLKLIRFQNLLIIALGMYMMRWMVVEPLMILSQTAPKLTSLDFFMLVISTVLIAAGGYIINDIEDERIDLINKQDKVIINKNINADTAHTIYLLLTFIGICIGFYLTFKREIIYVAYINCAVAGFLYFYSTTYKKMFLLGNIIISALTALTIAIVYLTEPEASNIEPLKILTTGYTVFAFVISLIREIIKDMEDINGDRIVGCRTLPIVAGINTGKVLVILIIALMLSFLVYMQVSSRQWESLISFTYVICFVQIPLILLGIMVVQSNNSKLFHRCSTVTKFIMVAGILSMPLFFYSFN